jgi:hypothetical protein
MEHEFSHDPVKVRVVDLKTGAVTKTYVWVGEVPEKVQKELVKLAKKRRDRKPPRSAVLQGFYGKGWVSRLGLEAQKTGGADKESMGSLGDEIDVDISLGDLDEIDVELLIPENDVEDAEAKGALQVSAETSVKSKLSVASCSVEFVFKTQVYPADNVMDLKHKVYLETGIPPYRQHLWFRHKNKAHACAYTHRTFKHVNPVDIESLGPFYRGETPEANVIEGIPVDTRAYGEKEHLSVIARDTFRLLVTNYETYQTNEYFLVDLNALVDPQRLWEKLGKDRGQLEMVYYGFVAIYFPMLTFPVFLEYLKNENQLSQSFPELAPDLAHLKSKVGIMGSVTDEAYLARDQAKTIAKKLHSSIVGTVVSITNYQQDIDILLVLRNVFDILPLSATVTYCKADLLHKGRRVILSKAYLNEPAPREALPMNSLMVKVKIAPDTHEHMRLIFFKNGNYIIRTSWREESHMDFKKITASVASRVNPIIARINAAGDQVKHHACTIAPVGPANIQFTETAFVFYYDDAVTEARYQVFKRTLLDMERGGIIAPRDKVSGSEDYYFRRGMYKFDPTRLEKAVATTNNYEYLSNAVVHHKWTALFERTRLFQVSNISSKLKITISGVRDEVENSIFFIYLMGMLKAYTATAHQIKAELAETLRNRSKRALRTLKLQDPLLYDFKRIYKSEVIYSKICQKPYQPLILSEEEAGQLSEEKASRAVKYWNFTKEAPAWYSCPNPKYPHVKFIVGQHPKGFCIPCCKKIPMGSNVNVKKQEIHRTCMTDYRFMGKKVSLTKGSNYIATYGKDIEVGRIARLPEHTLEPLFFDTYNPGSGLDPECSALEGYYLFGVDQHTPAQANVGYLFCLVHALNMTLETFLKATKEALRADKGKYRTLLDGRVSAYFSSVEDLTARLGDIGGEGLNDNREIPWNELFISLGYYYFGVNPIQFTDNGKEEINLILPKGLKAPAEMFPATHRSLVVMERNAHYYPVYLVNTDVFKQAGVIQERLFQNDSGLMTTVRAIVRNHFAGGDNDVIKTHIGLATIKEFATAVFGMELTGYYVNFSNLCYGVRITYQGASCYLPIRASHYSFDPGVDLVYKPPNPDAAVSLANLLKVTGVFNTWVKAATKRAGLGDVNIYPLIVPEKWLALQGSTKVYGFLMGGANYYCKETPIVTAQKAHQAPVHYDLYHPARINQLINKVKSGKAQVGVRKELREDIRTSAYNHHLYELLTLQFIQVFNDQRNNGLRRKILGQIAKTNFQKNTKPLLEFINEEISDVEDQEALKKIIGRYMTAHHKKATMVDDIKHTYFGFDRVSLERMKKMKYPAVVAELNRLAKKIVKVGKLPTATYFPNILTPCVGEKKNSETPAYCDGARLIIDRARLKDLIDVIAHDITNPTKHKWLFNSAFINRTVEFFRFIQRPKETVYVEFE